MARHFQEFHFLQIFWHIRLGRAVSRTTRALALSSRRLTSRDEVSRNLKTIHCNTQRRLLYRDGKRCEKMWKDVKRCEKMWKDVKRLYPSGSRIKSTLSNRLLQLFCSCRNKTEAPTCWIRSKNDKAAEACEACLQAPKAASQLISSGK